MSKDAGGYIQGVSRDQVVLLPPSIDEYVAENSPVRFIDAYVDSLDVVQYNFTHHTPATTGRPSYNPRALIKLLIYGYLRSIPSTRRLEEATIINLEVKWLLQNIVLDHTTINRFHTDNSKAFKKVFKGFNCFCRELGLIAGDLIAIDGAKLKAVNSEGRYRNLDNIKKIEEQAEQRIAKYQELLAKSGEEEQALFNEFSREEVQSKLAFWTEKKQAAKEQIQQLEAAGKTEQALTDTDSKRMTDRKHKNGVIGHNTQISVDGKHHLILDIETTTDKNDLNSLGKMAIAAQQELGIDPQNNEETLTVLVDTGYHQANELKKCQDNNIKAIVPAPKTTSGKTAKGEDVFPREKFTYDKSKDSFQCPAGKELPRKGTETKDDNKYGVYYNKAACAKCPLKAQCTTGEYRKLRRHVNQEAVEKAAVIYQDNKELFRQRKSIVEHVIGTLRNRGQGEFRRRGTEKIRGELSLSALAYNITRAINILGVGVLLEAIKA